MLKVTLFFVTKSNLALQILENSEVDLGSVITYLGCKSCAWAIVNKWKPCCLKYSDILHMSLKVTTT